MTTEMLPTDVDNPSASSAKRKAEEMAEYMWDIMVQLENGRTVVTHPQRLSVAIETAISDVETHVHEQVLADLNRARHDNVHWALGPVKEWVGYLAVHPDKVVLICTSTWPIPPEPEMVVSPAAEEPAGDAITELIPVVDASS